MVIKYTLIVEDNDMSDLTEINEIDEEANKAVAVHAIDALHLETLDAQERLSAVNVAIANTDTGGRNHRAERLYRLYLARIKQLIETGGDWRIYSRIGFSSALVYLQQASEASRAHEAVSTPGLEYIRAGTFEVDREGNFSGGFEKSCAGFVMVAVDKVHSRPGTFR